MRKVIFLAMMVLISTSVYGCGVKGSLESPSKQELKK